jgi:hypothetical protein
MFKPFSLAGWHTSFVFVKRAELDHLNIDLFEADKEKLLRLGCARVEMSWLAGRGGFQEGQVMIEIEGPRDLMKWIMDKTKNFEMNWEDYTYTIGFRYQPEDEGEPQSGTS